MNKHPVYKRIKTNWWIILLLAGAYLCAIFGSVFQWAGNYPKDGKEFLFLGSLLLGIIILFGRFKVIVNDEYAIFGTDVWARVKIPVTQIVSVRVVKADFMEMSIPWRYPLKYQFDFVDQAVSIQLRNGKAYQIAIKDAEQIKAEIEKRMLITNNKHQ